jgi:hypothetical protein
MAKYKPNQITFKIDAFTPASLPSIKLAQYLTYLSKLLGHEDRLHFERVGKGSAQLYQFTDQETMEIIRTRLHSIGSGDASIEVQRAYEDINQELIEDQATGNLRLGSATVIKFPGKKLAQEKTIGPIVQSDFLDGQLVRVGGFDATVPVHLRGSDGKPYICTTNIETAKNLAPYLYGATIRIFGTATWRRRENGEWELRKFSIDNFQALNDADLTDAIKTLQNTVDKWDRTILEKLDLR